MNIAVIGGGYAGMAAAVTLAERGIPATVLEAAMQLGGRARRVETRDATLDNGLHVLVGAHTETLRLIGQVNPDAGRVLLRRPLDWMIHRQFRLQAAALPAPFHLAAGILRMCGATFVERLRLASFMIRMRIHGYALAEDMTVDDLLRRHRQDARLCRMLWRPLCVAALNTPPDRASARVFLRVLRDSMGAARDRVDVLLPRTDLTALFPEPAAAYVEARGGAVRRNCRVTAIDARDGEIRLAAGGRDEAYSHAICALPPHQSGAFLAGIPALTDIVATIRNLAYQPIYSVYLRYPHSIRLPLPMVGFDGTLLQWAFDREFLCGQTGMIGVVISAGGAHQQLGHDELARLVHEELRQQLGIASEPSWHQVIAEKRATFSCTPALKRPPQKTPLPNFYLAGDYTASDYPATLEAAVRSGVACARHLLESI